MKTAEKKHKFQATCLLHAERRFQPGSANIPK